MSFSILYTVGGLAPEHGGPSRSLPSLVMAVARLGVQAELVTCGPSNGEPGPLLPPAELVRAQLLPWACRERQWLARRNGFFRAVQRAEGRRQRAEDGGQKTKDRGRSMEGRQTRLSAFPLFLRPLSSVLCPLSPVSFQRFSVSAFPTAPGWILHDTGVWLASNHAVAVAARRFGLPLIISPRGMLTPWALQYRGLKKRVAWALYQRRDLESAQVLHATSEKEAAELRALGLSQPIAVIPNGVEVPEAEQRTEDGGEKTEDRGQRTGEKLKAEMLKAEMGQGVSAPLAPDSALRTPHPAMAASALEQSAIRNPQSAMEGSAMGGSAIRNPHSEIKRVLFLGRIHPKKGLMELVRAWAMLRDNKTTGPRHYGTRGQRTGDRGQRTEDRGPGTGWRVVVAGSDEGGHLAEVRAEARRQRAEGDFEFVGAVEGEAKWDLYRQADLFVLPSHSENFGLVVAEALACGVPVITTRGTPWQDLERHRCGWWVELGVDPLSAALRQAMSLSEEERRQMGQRGRRLVQSRYTWPRVAEQMKAVYEWMLGRGPRPGCVFIKS